jgi:hypothetical protein
MGDELEGTVWSEAHRIRGAWPADPDPGWDVGDKAVYTSSDGRSEEVTIVKVHREDVELYYTIFIPSTNRERQTTLAALRKEEC